MSEIADYNLLSPQDMDELLFSPFDQALGAETRERIRRQLENYDYYEGRQHVDPRTGQLVKASELERPAGLDYDPTRYATNYFKAIVDRKARWQMGGRHGISVPRRQIDDIETTMAEGYTPSPEQLAENKRAEEYERLLYRLWDENKMRAQLVKAARDRLIADRVVCRIVFNQRTGKIRWLFRPDYEFIPVFSDDDFEDLIGAHFVKQRKWDADGTEIDAIQIQTYLTYYGQAFYSDVIYRASDLKEIKKVTPSAADVEDDEKRMELAIKKIREENKDKTKDEINAIIEARVKPKYLDVGGRHYAPMGLDFIPVVMFPVNELLTESIGDSEISALREQNDVLNQMNEDAIDSLKFEMFSMLAVLNATPGAAANVRIAPGAVLEAAGASDKPADIKTVESGFRWKDAFKDQYMRVKAAMHEISGLPQIVPQELNFGGLNGEALQVLFHDIITDTEEHWLSWGYALAELHEKTIRYLQARLSAPKFAYDKSVVRAIGTDYESEMRFVLPLPDNRKELVELLSLETAGGFESQKGAIERLGVENVQAKLQEIEGERSKRRAAADPYKYDDDADGGEDDE